MRSWLGGRLSARPPRLLGLGRLLTAWMSSGSITLGATTFSSMLGSFSGSHLLLYVDLLPFFPPKLRVHLAHSHMSWMTRAVTAKWVARGCLRKLLQVLRLAQGHSLPSQAGLVGFFTLGPHVRSVAGWQSHWRKLRTSRLKQLGCLSMLPSHSTDMFTSCSDFVSFFQ